MPGRTWHSPTATTWGSIGVRMLSVAVVLPLVLQRYAAPEIAVWQLFSVLFMLTMMLDFGMAPTFARLLAYARGGASVAQMGTLGMGAAATAAALPGDSAATVLSAQRWLYARLAVAATLLFAMVGTLALVLPVAQTADPQMAWTAWALVLATTGVGFWGNGYGAALQGLDRIAVLRRWEIGCGLAQVGSSTLVLLADGGLLALVASYQFWVVFNAVRNRMLVRRDFPALMAVKPSADMDVLRVLWPASWRSGLGTLFSQGIVQGSGVAYSQVGSPEAVAAYLLALRISTVISQLSQAPFYSKLPQLAKLHVTGQRQAQRSLAQRGMRMAYWTYVVGAVAIAASADALLSSVGSRIAFVSADIWALMSLALFAERFGAMHLQLYSVTNHIVWHIANGIAGSIVIMLAAGLYPALGLAALPLATLLAYAFFYCPYSFRRSSQAFGFELLGFERSVSLGPAAFLCIALAASWYLQ